MPVVVVVVVVVVAASSPKQFLHRRMAFSRNARPWKRRMRSNDTKATATASTDSAVGLGLRQRS